MWRLVGLSAWPYRFASRPSLWKRLPVYGAYSHFPLLGLDTDNDSAFMNDTLWNYCQKRGIIFTRSRAYRKNDQAWLEQKNGAVVCKLIGMGGFSETAALRPLYESSRLYINFFQPSFKLKSKTREGARVHKKYELPETPCRRLLRGAGFDSLTRLSILTQ